MIAPALLAGAAQAAGPADVPAFRREMASYFDALRKDDFAPPGFVIVVVHGGRTVLARAYGVRDVETRAPLTLHNPIYTGSSTKAYTGLLAAELALFGVERFERGHHECEELHDDARGDVRAHAEAA